MGVFSPPFVFSHILLRLLLSVEAEEEPFSISIA
jgi:hypothetical protein